MAGDAFLKTGNGHQRANRQKALAFIQTQLPELEIIDERTVRLAPYGVCHFSAFTHPDGAMISTPDRDDNAYGSADWHSCDRFMMFRDFGDGRVAAYICPIKPLFDKRTIGHHGVRWDDVRKLADKIEVFRSVQSC